MRQRYIRICTQEECDRLFSETTQTPITRTAFQSVNLPQKAIEKQFLDCLFLGCKIPQGLKSKLHDSLVFPDMGQIFSFRSSLYTCDELYDTYRMGQPQSIQTCYDTRVYHHYLRQGKRSTNIKETLARTLHDHSISSALHEFLAAYDERDVIGVMGGHGIPRDSPQYATVAHIAKHLTELGKLMISGGGPGAMEATHLGAWMAGRTEKELNQAIDIMAQAPTFEHILWLEQAILVRQRYPQTKYKSIGIPTWLYGHEPTTPLATHIAKYFDNSIREDGILTLAMGGIVFTPGSAGTLQEIFQEAVQNHYLSFGYASPMIFLGKAYWTEEIPVYPLIENLVARGKYKNLILSLTDDTQDVVRELVRNNS